MGGAMHWGGGIHNRYDRCQEHRVNFFYKPEGIDSGDKHMLPTYVNNPN